MYTRKLNKRISDWNDSILILFSWTKIWAIHNICLLPLIGKNSHDIPLQWFFCTHTFQYITGGYVDLFGVEYNIFRNGVQDKTIVISEVNKLKIKTKNIIQHHKTKNTHIRRTSFLELRIGINFNRVRVGEYQRIKVY